MDTRMLPFAKPPPKKKHKPKRNPVPTANDYCEVCGRAYAELHEIFYAENR